MNECYLKHFCFENSLSSFLLFNAMCITVACYKLCILLNHIMVNNILFNNNRIFLFIYLNGMGGIMSLLLLY